MTRAALWRVYGSPILLIAACIITFVALMRAGATDFLTFQQSGRQLLAGADPYLPFNVHRGANMNPPWVVAAMAPLARLPITGGLAVWWAIGFACLFVSATVAARTAAPGQAIPIACAVLVTQAAYSNIAVGQVAWPVMLLLTLAWSRDLEGREIWCGVLLGLAIAWKPFLLLFVPYLIWRRAWRTLAATGAAVLVTIVAGVTALGPSSYRSWIGALGVVNWEEGLLNGSLRGMVARLVSPPTITGVGTTPLVVAPSWLIPAWLIAGGAVAAIATLRLIATRDRNQAWASVTLLAILLSPLGWIHYVPLAAGPIVGTLRGERGWSVGLCVMGWLLLCVPYMWLRSHGFGPLGTLTVASSYTWGTVLMLTGVLLARGANERRMA